MENKKTLNLAQLKGKNASEDDRIARNSLEHRLLKSPLVMRVSKYPVYTLSTDALDGIYAAVVPEMYLPVNWRSLI